VLTTILIGGLVLAIVMAGAAAVVAVRARRQADERVAEAIARLATGMQETMRDMAEAAEADAAVGRGPERYSGELAASLDLDEVTERTLEAVAAVAGVDAAFLSAAAPDGGRVTATVGMAADEAERTAVSVPENDNLRAVEVTYLYRLDDVQGSAPVVRAGVVFPLRADGETIGALSVFTRSSERRLGEGEIDDLDRLAFRAGPALENARSYAEARALADLDALTGLHNRRFFHELLAREVARAHRYGRRLALIVFDIDDFKAVNDRVGHLQGDAVLAEAAARLLGVVRTADVACRIGGDEFALVLPESSAADAELLAGRVARAIGARPIGGAGILRLSAGVAELQPNDVPNDLFDRGDDALYRAKELGKSRTVLGDGA
jgi:diguanylate cyclase (GGDEF)-like protein